MLLCGPGSHSAEILKGPRLVHTLPARPGRKSSLQKQQQTRHKHGTVSAVPSVAITCGCRPAHGTSESDCTQHWSLYCAAVVRGWPCAPRLFGARGNSGNNKSLEFSVILASTAQMSHSALTATT